MSAQPYTLRMKQNIPSFYGTAGLIFNKFSSQRPAGDRAKETREPRQCWILFVVTFDDKEIFNVAFSPRGWDRWDLDLHGENVEWSRYR